MDFRTYQQFRTYCREDLREWTDLPGYAEVARMWWKLEGRVGVIRREAQVADNLHQCSDITPRQRAAAELLNVISHHRITSWLREPEPPKGYAREEPLSQEDADALARETIASVTRYAAFLPEREAAVLLADCKIFEAAAPSGTPDDAAPPVPAATPADSAVGIVSSEIIEKFRLGDEWGEKLRKPGNYKYLLPALAQRGQRGGDPHRWNPARFGAILIERKERKLLAVSTVIFHKFAEWGDEWQSIIDASEKGIL